MEGDTPPWPCFSFKFNNLFNNLNSFKFSKP